MAAMIEFLGGVVPFLAFLLGFWLMRPRRKQRAAVKTNPVAGLLRWHAVWERDNPDKILWASYTDYLPADPPKGNLRPAFGMTSQEFIEGAKRFSGTLAQVGERGPETVVILPEGMTFHPNPVCQRCNVNMTGVRGALCPRCRGFSPGGWLPSL